MTVQRAAWAGFWSMIDVGVRQGVQFIVSLILARLLVPADFGLVALMTFFSTLAQGVMQGGLTTALIQHQDTTIEEESTVFWINLMASAALALILVWLAPTVSTFYGQPNLRPLMFVAATQVIISGVGAVQAALLTKQLNFAGLARAGVFSALLSGGSGITAAVLGAGLWALALQILVAAAAYSGAIWWVSGWRPGLYFRPASIMPMLGFGGWLSISSILDVFYTQGFSLLVGKLHGVRDLGLYNRAAGTQGLPSLILQTIIGRVALPLFSPRSKDAAAMRRGMRLALGISMLINAPMMVGLALLPDVALQTLFGTKWLPAAPILSILAASGLLYPLHVINVQILLAQGGSRFLFQLEVLKKLVGVACVAVGSLFGIKGLAWSQVIANIFFLALNGIPARRSIAYGPLAQLWDLRGVFLCSFAMGGMIWAARQIINLPPALELTLLSLLGAAVYFSCGFGFRVSSFLDGWRVFRLMTNRKLEPSSRNEEAFAGTRSREGE